MILFIRGWLCPWTAVHCADFTVVPENRAITLTRVQYGLRVLY